MSVKIAGLMTMKIDNCLISIGRYCSRHCLDSFPRWQSGVASSQMLLSLGHTRFLGVSSRDI